MIVSGRGGLPARRFVVCLRRCRTPYYEYMLREHGFSAAADAACQYVPAGQLERAVEAIPDEAVDRLTMAGTADEVRKRSADYEGIVDEVICVNVFYSAGDQSSMLDAYRRLIHL